MEVETIRVGYDRTVVSVQGNVSASGLGFWLEAEEPPRVGDPLLAEVEAVNEEAVIIPARVVHVRFDAHRQAYYIGAAFLPTDELVDGALYRFVEERILAERTGIIA